MQPPKIVNALLGKDSNAREKAIRWVIKHLNDEEDQDLDWISDKVKSVMQIVHLAVEDKVFKVLSKGLDLMEQLTISFLLECDLGFTVFAHFLNECDLIFTLCCRVED